MILKSNYNLDRNNILKVPGNNTVFQFKEWLVGFTDGDGNFSLTKKRNSWCFEFSLTQSVYNARILLYILKNLGVGGIYKQGKTGLRFRITDSKVLKDVIVTIFDKYLLHSSKGYYYCLWREALLHKQDGTLCAKNHALLSQEVPATYITNNQTPTKSWVIGFIEAEGSFYVFKKGEMDTALKNSQDPSPKHVKHGFGIEQKLDPLLLKNIGNILHINANVYYNPEKDSYALITSSKASIEHMVQYFDNTFKGMKAVEFRIWKNNFLYHKDDKLKLLKDQQYVRDLKQKAILSYTPLKKPIKTSSLKASKRGSC